MVSLTEIAQFMGVSVSTISRAKQEGLQNNDPMPQDSVESARDWYERNRKNPPRSPNAQGIEPANMGEDVDAGSVTGSDLLRDDIYGCLARAKKSEKVAYALLHQAQANRDHARITNFVKAHREAVRARMDSEERVESLQRATGAVIGTDLAKSIMARYMTTIRSLLESMPARASRRCNPSDPELAKEIITEEVEKIIAVIHKTRGAFGGKEISLDEEIKNEVKTENEQKE
jgi:hypothetical protein